MEEEESEQRPEKERLREEERVGDKEMANGNWTPSRVSGSRVRNAVEGPGLRTRVAGKTQAGEQRAGYLRERGGDVDRPRGRKRT